MDPFQGSEAIQQFMKLLEENNQQGQAADLSALIWYMDGMNRQYEAVLQELQEVRRQLAQEQEPSEKYAMQNAAAKLEHSVHQIKEALDNLRTKIARCAASAVENFKEAGVSALDTAVSAMGVKDALESMQRKISGMIANTRSIIENMERVGCELRSAGSHLKNARRAMTSRETQTVDGGQEGRFQSVVLAPMRTAQKLLFSMNNATLAAIGNMEHLELAAEAARTAKAERQAEKKPSIRQVLAERKAEAAARPDPAPDKDRRLQEAAL